MVSILIVPPRTGIKQKAKVSRGHASVAEVLSTVESKCSVTGDSRFTRDHLNSLRRAEQETTVPPGLGPTDGPLTLTGATSERSLHPALEEHRSLQKTFSQDGVTFTCQLLSAKTYLSIETGKLLNNFIKHFLARACAAAC